VVFLSLLCAGAVEAQRGRGEVPGKSAGSLLTQVRHTSSPSYTRVTLELSAETRFEAHVLKEDPAKGLPPRIYVDLLGTRVALSAARPIAVQDGLLRQVRVRQFSPDVVRVVLDLNRPTEHKAFLLPGPHRLVIDIHAEKNGADAAPPTQGKVSTPPKLGA